MKKRKPIRSLDLRRRKPGDRSQRAVDVSYPAAPHKPASWKRWLLLALSIAMIVAGLYIGNLLLAPKAGLGVVSGKTAIDLNTADDATDNRNRIQIEKINLEVPYFTGGAGELDKGAWHRFPERGNPEKGGNFILSAHRFNIGTTPAETKLRSPFYNLDKLKVDDAMRVYFDGKWYDYKVTKVYSVKPNEIQIEAPSKEAKLTLYSCSLGGSADGRIVIEAKLQ